MIKKKIQKKREAERWYAQTIKKKIQGKKRRKSKCHYDNVPQMIKKKIQGKKTKVVTKTTRLRKKKDDMR